MNLRRNLCETIARLLRALRSSARPAKPYKAYYVVHLPTSLFRIQCFSFQLPVLCCFSTLPYLRFSWGQLIIVHKSKLVLPLTTCARQNTLFCLALRCNDIFAELHVYCLASSPRSTMHGDLFRGDRAARRTCIHDFQVWKFETLDVFVVPSPSFQYRKNAKNCKLLIDVWKETEI